MRFDTHLHVWWPGDGAAVRIRTTLPDLDRDFSFERMRSTLLATRVSRVILVAAAQQEDQNARLVEIAKKNPDLVAGVIGWLDVEARDVELRVSTYAEDPIWLGIRLPLTIHDDRRYVLRPEVRRALVALRSHGAIAEFLVGPDQLIDVAVVLRELPGLRAVLDHAGNPDFSTPPRQDWCRDLAALASLPDVVCKISNFWTPGDPPVRDVIALAFFREVVAAFGATRTIAGANWPPSGLAGPYAASWDRLDRLVATFGLDSVAARAILFDNAVRIFRTPEI
jgi:L-fuconolactonase